MPRLATLLAIGCIAAFGLVACGGDDGDGETTAAETGAAESDAGSGGGETFGLLLAGPRNDKGFYEHALKGLESAAGPDANISVADNIQEQQAEFDAMQSMSEDADLIITSGSFGPAVVENLAPQYPDVEYVVLATGVVDDSLPNVHAYSPRQGIPAYIAGAVAAELSKSKHVGFVGGPEISVTEAADAGFAAGAKDHTPGIKVASTAVGTFSDPAKAKAGAAAQIAAGADALYAFMDAGTPGVQQAIDEAGVDGYLMGAIAPRCEESDIYVGTTLMNVEALVATVVDDFRNGNLAPGTKFFGVEDPDIQSFALCPAWEKDGLPELVEELTDKLNNDEIDLPEAALK